MIREDPLVRLEGGMAMLAWLEANIATILIGFALAAVVALAVRKLARDMRAGRSACGCGCQNCAARGECHKK